MNLRAKTAPLAIVTMLMALPIYAGQADEPCNADAIRNRLAQLEQAFRNPKIQAGMAAAKKDWDEDQDFDDEEGVKYLGAVAAYHDIKRNFDAGGVEDACMLLKRSDPIVQSVLDEL